MSVCLYSNFLSISPCLSVPCLPPLQLSSFCPHVFLSLRPTVFMSFVYLSFCLFYFVCLVFCLLALQSFCPYVCMSVLYFVFRSFSILHVLLSFVQLYCLSLFLMFIVFLSFVFLHFYLCVRKCNLYIYRFLVVWKSIHLFLFWRGIIIMCCFSCARTYTRTEY